VKGLFWSETELRGGEPVEMGVLDRWFRLYCKVPLQKEPVRKGTVEMGAAVEIRVVNQPNARKMTVTVVILVCGFSVTGQVIPLKMPEGYVAENLRQCVQG
jgi:hypothetical protein